MKMTGTSQICHKLCDKVKRTTRARYPIPNTISSTLEGVSSVLDAEIYDASSLSAIFVLVLDSLPSLWGVKILFANSVRVFVLVIRNPVRVFTPTRERGFEYGRCVAERSTAFEYDANNETL